MYLYLVRHGQSVGNERQLFFGRSDHPLTELGREHARQAAQMLKEVNFTRCVSSDLTRAWDTAMACVEGRGIEAEAEPALREQDMGDLEDLTFAQAQERHGETFARMLADWTRVDPPGGESVAHMKERISRCVDRVVRLGEDTLIVAHNGSLSLILSHFGLAKESELMNHDYNWFFEHGTYSVIRVDETGAELACFNREARRSGP